MYKNLTLYRNVKLINCLAGRTDSTDLLFTRNGGKSELLQMGKGIRIGTPDGLTEIFAHGKLAAPSFTDLRATIPDPGYVYRETLSGGLFSAMSGGFGQVLLNPCTVPPKDSEESLLLGIERAKKASDCKALFSVPLTKGGSGHTLCDFMKLKKAGAVAVNADFESLCNPSLLFEGAEKAAEAGLFFIAPSGDPLLNQKGSVNKGSVSKMLQVEGLDESSELFALSTAIVIAKTKNVPVHFPLVSLKSSVALLRKAKETGIPITASTAPPYFSFTDGELLFSGAEAKLLPPLRKEEDRLAVIEGLKDGTIDAICSDHSPYAQSEKGHNKLEELRNARFGAVGFETAFAAGVTHLILPGHLSIYRLIELMSLRPRELLHEKAGVELGLPVDLVFLSPEEEMVYTSNTLRSRSYNTPFYGRSLYGRVKELWVDGIREFSLTDLY